MALLWGYFSRFSSIASSLIIMPFALVSFSEAEFSIWMIFVVFYGLIIVFDFGLSSTFSRQINYVLSGAQDLKKVGVTEQFNSESINYLLFSKIIDCAKFVFLSIALITALILTFTYIFYLNRIANNSGLDIKLEWLLYSLAIIGNIFCLLYNSLFFGTNNVVSIYRVASFSNIAFFCIAIILILCGYTLIAVAVARIISVVVYYFSAKYEVVKFKMLYGYTRSSWQNAKSTLTVILPNAGRIGIVSLGNFILTKLSILIVAYYFIASESASYALALNLFAILSSVSLLYMNIITPAINRALQERAYSKVKALQSKARKASLIMVILGCIALLVIAPKLLTLIGSQTSLPSFTVLILFSLMTFLDVNRQVSMNFIAATNHIPFTKAVMLSSVAILVAIIIIFEAGHFSFLVPLVVQLIVQSLFNNWYWTLIEKRTIANYDA